MSGGASDQPNPSPLHWFPFETADWLANPSVARMLPEQEGALLRLLFLAWGDGSKEPSLPASDRDLAAMSRLGTRWRRLGGLIREQFRDRDGIGSAREANRERAA